MLPNKDSKVGEIFQDGAIDPETNEPYYYRITSINDGCICSHRCHSDGKDYVKIIRQPELHNDSTQT